MTRSSQATIKLMAKTAAPAAQKTELTAADITQNTLQASKQ
jgi:hypothetical protein